MNYNPFSLADKRILITGASSGIGQATAIECAKMGAEVVLTGRSEARLNDTLECIQGHKASIIAGDLTKPEDASALLASVGLLDGVVLCAGIGKTLPLQFCTRENFDNIFEINFFAQAELLRNLIKKRILRKGSSVVIVSSIGGVYTYEVGNAMYGTSKAALNSLMKYFALEFANVGIRVNSVNPGMVDTPLIHRGTISDEQLNEYKNKYPMKRFGRPEEVAYGIIYLLSDAASWVTGHSLVIGGNIQ